jgi:hypothetical protein
MKCQSIKKLLVLYIGDDLPRKKMISARSHIEQCPNCKAELDELMKMKSRIERMALNDIPEALHPDFAEKVTGQIDRDRVTAPPTRDRIPRWFLPIPVRAIGILALVFILVFAGLVFLLAPGKMTPERIAQKLISASERGSHELDWDPDHIFFKAFDGPYRIDSWDAPNQSGVYALMHKTISEQGTTTYVIDYCGQGRNLSAYRGYPWIQHRRKRLISRAGSHENIYVAVFLMPDSTKQERRQIEDALLKTFNPYFNRGV